ncbi:CBS domain-containing protein [Lentzea sp. BCCO 10_0798]|uniref:CBS domain-containing protein n=1 Tax=Lentzea kristufekii TaxID=3095430 RepID=A0ABU4TX26_9PSEU|nr:CBS domain-containing protein [Lentzea sp. BCCO 10_0798]MDX8052366.1 CBS domain-containing protein [Lentzea sp. BCCO 10_0798]
MKAADAMVRPLVTVGPRDFARHAEGLMDDFGLTMLPVVDGSAFLGVVTRAGCRRGEDELPKVERVMSQPELTVGPEFDVATLFEAMTRYEVLCVPVLDDGQVIGVVTRLDVLRALSHDDPHLRVGHAAEHG